MGELTSNAAQNIEPPRLNEIELFSTTIGKIYDCVLEPDTWTEALGYTRTLTGASLAVMHWGDLRARTVLETYHVNTPPTMLQAMRDKSIYWATQVGTESWKVGEVHYLADLLPREELERGRFYREVLKPHRQVDYMGMLPVMDQQRLATFSVATDEDIGYFEPRAVELMRLVAPHITRAANISAAFDMRTLQADMLQSAIDSLASGILLLDYKMLVVYSNGTAQRMLGETRGFRLAGRKIKISDVAAESELHAAIHAAQNPATRNAAISVTIPDAENPLVLTVIPVASGRRQNLLGGLDAATAVFIQNVGLMPPIPSNVFRRLYGFTPKETRLRTH